MLFLSCFMLCERKAKNRGSDFSGFHFQHNVQNWQLTSATGQRWFEYEGNSFLKNLTIGGFKCWFQNFDSDTNFQAARLMANLIENKATYVFDCWFCFYVKFPRFSLKMAMSLGLVRWERCFINGVTEVRSHLRTAKPRSSFYYPLRRKTCG